MERQPKGFTMSHTQLRYRNRRPGRPASRLSLTGRRHLAMAYGGHADGGGRCAESSGWPIWENATEWSMPKFSALFGGNTEEAADWCDKP